MRRGPDHGHAVFDDGFEVEFGWTEPTEEQLAEAGGSRLDHAKRVACAWANADRDAAQPYAPDRIVSIRLAG